MNRQKVLFALALVMLFAGMCPAGIIVSVDRSRGQPLTGTTTKSPIGTFDSETDPLIGVVGDGMGVFSDRTYPWANTPVGGVWGTTEDLSGADLVMTFNDDKSTSEIMVTYTVTISEAAYLAISVDDRIGVDATEFLTQQEAVDWTTSMIGAAFVDTGLDLFIQENASTQRQMSVYATTVKMDAGTYVFGSQPAGKNFYSIIAVPEPATLMLLGLGGLLLRKRR
jgi:hypothetical protein